MKKVLLRIYRVYRGCRNVCKWKRQGEKRIISLDQAQAIQDELELSAEEKILIVVPHPDDELIACDGIIRRFKDNVVVFYSGMLGGNNSEENKKTRTSEFIKYCESVGAEYVVNTDDVYKGLERVIAKDKFKFIFAPSVVDWHEEHRKLFAYTVEINEKQEQKAKVFCYQVTVPIPQEYVTHYLQMTKQEQKRKWQIFKEIYLSQGHMPVWRFKIAERSFERQKERIICEVFMRFDKKSFNGEYMCPIEQGGIADLSAILKSSKAQYRKAFKNTAKGKNGNV